jgi:hypothetical protein
MPPSTGDMVSFLGPDRFGYPGWGVTAAGWRRTPRADQDGPTPLPSITKYDPGVPYLVEVIFCRRVMASTHDPNDSA